MDVVSDYFDIQLMAGSTKPNIKIKTADYLGGNDFTDAANWRAPVDADSSITYTLSEDGDTIRVKGFNYDTNYISSTARDNNFFGRKLILEIVTKPDYTAIDNAFAAGILTSENIPTNDTAAILDSSNINVAYTTSPTLKANKVLYQIDERGSIRTHGTFYRYPGAAVQVFAKPINTPEYSYSEWSSTDVTISNNGFTMPEGDAVLMSVASVNKYTVSYEYRDFVPQGTYPASAPASKDYASGEVVDLAKVEAPEGYVFSGWVEDDLDVPANTTAFHMPTEDLHFVGYFIAEPSEWKVEYYFEVLDDTPGTVDYAQTADDTDTFTANTGTEVTATVPHFDGFTYDSNGANVTKGTVKGDGSLTLKLYYKRNLHSVSYEYINTVIGASQLPATVQYKYGQIVDIAPAATAPGYTFSGWSIRSGASAIENGQMKMPDSDVVLRGSFVANSGTAYRVEHYFESSESTDKNDRSNYEIKPAY
ncbi:MAG: hypothetical protein E7623_05335, partial [Ruminococcaceae bacterium]|nr:hypothetical protein [Oscillospiraceae bacterium]